MGLTGRRFMAFRPFGSRMHLEHDVVFLAEHWRWSRTEVLALPCSERFRYVKMKEEINRQAQNRARAKNRAGSRPKGFRRH